jgi:hypothetical protein
MKPRTKSRRPFDPAPRDLRMNRAAARFTILRPALLLPVSPCTRWQILIATQILELELTRSQQTRNHFLIATFSAVSRWRRECANQEIAVPRNVQAADHKSRITIHLALPKSIASFCRVSRNYNGKGKGRSTGKIAYATQHFQGCFSSQRPRTAAACSQMARSSEVKAARKWLSISISPTTFFSTKTGTTISDLVSSEQAR